MKLLAEPTLLHEYDDRGRRGRTVFPAYRSVVWAWLATERRWLLTQVLRVGKDGDLFLFDCLDARALNMETTHGWITHWVPISPPASPPSPAPAYDPRF